MTTLPEPYQHHTAPAGQPLPGWPTAPLEGPVEMYGERPPVAWVQDPYNPGRSVPIDARLIHRPEPLPQRDLTPQPLIDPRAQILAGGGVFAAGTGWGIGQALAPLAGLSTGALVAVAAVVVAARLAPVQGRSKTVINHTTNVANTNRWWGKSSTTVHH